MRRRIPFEYRAPALDREIVELVRDLSPRETEGLEPCVRDTLGGALIVASKKCRTYSVRLDGRLAGVCFVEDRPDRRVMAFTKTRFLTEERKVTFARGIPQLLDDLARGEAARRRGGKPMYMHVPEGDERSKAWFVRAGCVETEHGLLCPAQGKET